MKSLENKKKSEDLFESRKKPYRLSELYASKEKVLSFEVFPPKTRQGIDNLIQHLRKLSSFQPDYISVTYGAGGSTRDVSLEILDQIHQAFTCEVMAHFTCVGTDEEGILSFVRKLQSTGIENILALRGDAPSMDPHFDFRKGCFKYAIELVKFLKSHTDFCIGVAAFPEGHSEALSPEKDWDHLQAKIEAGASFAITQLFFDNDDFYRFRDAMDKRGVSAPMVPGILPVASLDRLQRIVNLSGSRISKTFQEIAEKYQGDEAGFREASLEFSRNQVRDLLQKGVPGIHFYILNQSELISDLLNTL